MTLLDRPASAPSGASRRIIGRGLRVAALAVTLGLSGCGAVKLAYNNIHEVAYWWLDGYLDLSEAQRPQLREDLARVHQWHRTNELPMVLPLLQRAEALVAGNATPEAVCALADAAQERVTSLLAHVEPLAVPYATTLAPSQLAALQRKYAKVNAEFREDWIDATPAAQRTLRGKKYIDRAESLYGRLDTPQRDLLRQQAAQSQADPRIEFTERQRRQADVLATLTRLSTQPHTPADAQARLHAVALRVAQAPDPAVRAYQLAARQEACRNTAALHAVLTPAQRQRALERLRGWQRDVSDLAMR